MSHSAITMALTAPTSQPTTTGLFSTCGSSSSSSGSFAQMHAQDAATHTELQSNQRAPLSCHSSVHCTPFLCLPSQTCWPPSPASHRSRRACCWRRQPRGGLQQQRGRPAQAAAAVGWHGGAKGGPGSTWGQSAYSEYACTCTQGVATTKTEHERPF
jgi:hypothetical protein